MRTMSALGEKGVAILMYHSVSEDPSADRDTLGAIGHSADVFRQQMELLASEFHPISMEEVVRFVEGQQDLPRWSVAVTFDDGYADNYRLAAPVLNRLGITATFYVTVECVKQGILPWPARARYALFTTKNSTWCDPDGRSWPLHTVALRSQAFEQACKYASALAGADQTRLISSLEGQLQAALAQGPPMLGWDEVRTLMKQGHIIGSHTLTHPNMAHINEKALKREFNESKQALERELGKPIVHFSYPCPALQPHWTERTIQVSRESGYQTAVTTDGGMVRRNDNPLRLRRIRPSKNVTGLRANLEWAFLRRRE